MNSGPTAELYKSRFFISFLHYSGDFFITIVLVLCSIKGPITVFTSFFKELSGATVSDIHIKEPIFLAAIKYFSDIATIPSCNIIKTSNSGEIIKNVR